MLDVFGGKKVMKRGKGATCILKWLTQKRHYALVNKKTERKRSRKERQHPVRQFDCLPLKSNEQSRILWVLPSQRGVHGIQIVGTADKLGETPENQR